MPRRQDNMALASFEFLALCYSRSPAGFSNWLGGGPGEPFARAGKAQIAPLPSRSTVKHSVAEWVADSLLECLRFDHQDQARRFACFPGSLPFVEIRTHQEAPTDKFVPSQAFVLPVLCILCVACNDRSVRESIEVVCGFSTRSGE